MTPTRRELFVAPWREQQQRDRAVPSAEPATPLVPPLVSASHFASSTEHLLLSNEK
jgi:hypothetical protein